MSDATNLTPASPSGPPAGWYDAQDGSPRQQYWDGTTWTAHYQAKPTTAPAAAQQPIQVTVTNPGDGNLRGRDKAQYVRQQKGHSFIVQWFLVGPFTLWIPAIYYAVSKNHYYHL